MTEGHPYWKAINTFDHLRPCDPSRDCRTPERRAREGGVPYTSVWLNVDDELMYPAARALKELRFDSFQANTDMLDSCESNTTRILQSQSDPICVL